MIPILFVLIGAFSLAAQAILFREYLVVHHGNELAVGLFYASWFAWIALGAAAVLARRSWLNALADRFAGLLALYPVALLVQILLIRSLRQLAGVPPAEPFPPGSLALWTALSNAPVSLTTGLLFPAGCAAVHKGQSQLGAAAAVTRLYVLEALGAFFGGLLITAALARLVPPVEIGLGAAMLLCAGGLWLAARARRRHEALLHGLVLVAAAVGLFTPLGERLGRSSIERRFSALLPEATLIASRDTPYQNAAVARRGEQLLLLSNGRIVASFPDEQLEAMRAALLMSQPRSARRVLLLGSGAQGLARQMLAYPLERLTYVEPDQTAYRLAEPHLPEAERQAMADPRVRVAFTDGRLFVRELAQGGTERFDLVVVALPDPDTAQLNRYYTEEFYRTASALLEPGGVLVTRISSGENALGTELASYGASVLLTLESVFGEVRATPGEESWLLAAEEPRVVELDPDRLAQRYAALRVHPRRFPAEGFSSLLDPGRVEFVAEAYRQRAEHEPEALLNRDARPVTYFLNLLVLGRETDSPLVALLRAARQAGPWLLLLPVVVFLLLRGHLGALGGPSPKIRRFGASWLLFTFGLSSMGLQIVLFYAFQNRFGVLFQQIGLIGALFMIGLALGGAIGRRALVKRPVGWGLGIVAALVLLTLAIPAAVGWLATLEPRAARALYYALFGASGLLCGAAFPVAGAVAEPTLQGAGRLGSLLESADHWGAALGAALVGALMVPVLGMQASAGIIAALLATAAVPLVLGEKRPCQAAARALRTVRLLRAPAQADARARSLSFPWLGLSYLLLGAVVSVTLVAALLRGAAEEPGTHIDRRKLDVAVEAERFEAIVDPFLHYRAFAKDAAEHHNATCSSLTVADEVLGYAGPLNLLVSVDADGTIRRVELLSSNETPSYIADIGSWLGRFEGQSIQQRFRLVDSGSASTEHELDAMTGATVTSRAAVETVNRTKEALGRGAFGMEVENEPTDSQGPSPWNAEAIYVVLALALALPVYLRGSRRARTAFLALNLALAGLVFNLQLSLFHLTELSSLRLPSLANLPVFALIVGVGALAVAFGPVYCALLCPFGAAQELVFGASKRGARSGASRWFGWLRAALALGLALWLVDRAAAAVLPSIASRLGRDLLLGLLLAGAFWILRRAARRATTTISPELSARARYLKYLLLGLVLGGYALSGSEAARAFDPLAAAFSGSYRLWTFLLLASLLLLCLHYFRFWCRYFCPVGALLHLFNKVGLLLGLARSKAYGNCELGVRSKHDVDCLQCNRCLSGATGLGATRPPSLEKQTVEDGHGARA